MSQEQPQLERIIYFLVDIGLDAKRVDVVPSGTFVPRVLLEAGGLRVAPGCAASDLLHEAGHLAITPARFRTWMSGDLAKGQRRMFKAVEDEGIEPDSVLMRAVIQ